MLSKFLFQTARGRSNYLVVVFFALADSFLTEMLCMIFPRMVFGRVCIAERNVCFYMFLAQGTQEGSTEIFTGSSIHKHKNI